MLAAACDAVAKSAAATGVPTWCGASTDNILYSCLLLLETLFEEDSQRKEFE
jgi:hypothetical protein